MGAIKMCRAIELYEMKAFNRSILFLWRHMCVLYDLFYSGNWANLRPIVGRQLGQRVALDSSPMTGNRLTQLGKPLM